MEFKTDNRPLFDFSLEEVEAAGWKLSASTYDLHRDPVLNEGNVMTEYEAKFSALGNPIHKYIAYRVKINKNGSVSWENDADAVADDGGCTGKSAGISGCSACGVIWTR